MKKSFFFLMAVMLSTSFVLSGCGLIETVVNNVRNKEKWGNDNYEFINENVDINLNDNVEENAPSQTPPEMPSDFEVFGEHRYKFFTLDSVKTWEDAKAYCESLGGHLAIITTSEENDFLYQLMEEAGYVNAYFGLTDSQEEGCWVWVDGSEADYINWSLGEPNAENPNEDYAMFYWKFTDGTWNDGDFGNQTDNGGTTFICEWDN